MEEGYQQKQKEKFKPPKERLVLNQEAERQAVERQERERPGGRGTVIRRNEYITPYMYVRDGKTTYKIENNPNLEGAEIILHVVEEIKRIEKMRDEMTMNAIIQPLDLLKIDDEGWQRFIRENWKKDQEESLTLDENIAAENTKGIS